MRLKFSLHGLCLSLITSLVFWIVWNKTGDRHAILQAEMAFAFEKSYTKLKQYYQEGVMPGIFEKGIYSNSDSTQVRNLIKACRQITSDVEKAFEKLEQPRQTIQNLQDGQRNLRAYREKILELTDQDELTAAVMWVFPDTDWLVQAYQNGAPADFACVLAETKINAALMEEAMLYYIRHKAGGGSIICTGSGLHATYQPINPEPHEPIAAEVFLTEDVPDFLLMYFLNGKILPVQDHKATFELRYDKPGLYPLRFALSRRNWLTDSTEHFEKTYLLRVRE